MAWLNLREEIEDMFSILEVPDFALKGMMNEDEHWGGFLIIRNQSEYLKEYRNRPEVKARAKKLGRDYRNEYRRRPEVRERNRSKETERMRQYRAKLKEKRANETPSPRQELGT